MIEDNLLQYQLRKVEEFIEQARGDLETRATFEDMRFTQGYLAAFRVMQDVLREQYSNWIHGEEEAETHVTNLERMLDIAPRDEES
jgi:hypothetical protein